VITWNPPSAPYSLKSFRLPKLAVMEKEALYFDLDGLAGIIAGMAQARTASEQATALEVELTALEQVNPDFYEETRDLITMLFIAVSNQGESQTLEPDTSKAIIDARLAGAF
jgi:hypothetical protein